MTEVEVITTESTSTPSIPSNNSLNRINHQKTPFGNYHNYYFHRSPVVPDVRLSLLSPSSTLTPNLDLFKGKRILDLGCNAGLISIQSLIYLNPLEVKGIDIDSILIQQSFTAKESKLKQLELESKESEESNQLLEKLNSKLSFICEDFMREDYFNQLLIKSGQFDTILLFSITKWLHLNHGDLGLISLFKNLFTFLPTGGHLVIEPQEWDNYKSAVKKNKDLKPVFKGLEIRPPFINELVEIGFTLVEQIEREEGGFSRPLIVFRKD